MVMAPIPKFQSPDCPPTVMQVMRPLFYEFPDDPVCKTAAANDQFMFGAKLLVRFLSSSSLFTPPCLNGEADSECAERKARAEVSKAAHGSSLSSLLSAFIFPLISPLTSFSSHRSSLHRAIDSELSGQSAGGSDLPDMRVGQLLLHRSASLPARAP